MFAHMHARIQKVLSEGVKFDNVFFLVDEVIENPNITINGPSSEMAFRWQADAGETLNAGLIAL